MSLEVWEEGKKYGKWKFKNFWNWWDSIFWQCNTKILLNSINEHLICPEDRSCILQNGQKQLQWKNLWSQFMRSGMKQYSMCQPKVSHKTNKQTFFWEINTPQWLFMWNTHAIITNLKKIWYRKSHEKMFFSVKLVTLQPRGWARITFTSYCFLPLLPILSSITQHTS